MVNVCLPNWPISSIKIGSMLVLLTIVYPLYTQ